MGENLFYNGTKLINSKDINGNKPGIFVVDGNRSAGKTTYYSRMFINRFKRYGEKFMLIYRTKNELPGVEDKFFKDIQGLFFPKDLMTAEKREDGTFFELYLNEKSCGYAIPLSMASKIKKLSHFFSDVKRILFDEFQDSSSNYLPDEVNKFLTVYVSVARGQGLPVRYVPVYMVSNHVSSLNPYYKEWGCSVEVDNIKEGFYKGDGFVIEKNLNLKVANLQKESPVLRAFANTSTAKHIIDNESLSDNHSFIEKIKLKESNYICNIVCDGETISLRSVYINGEALYYFTDEYNNTFKLSYAVDTQNHDIDTILSGRTRLQMLSVKRAFDNGKCRFSDISVKEKAFKFLLIAV